VKSFCKLVMRVWRYLSVYPLNLSITLKSGQTFGWVENQHGEFLGVISSCIVVRLRQCLDDVFRVELDESLLKEQNIDVETVCESLADYFSARFDLVKLWQNWEERDLRFRAVSKRFYALRILRQDPVECFFSFICSSNNNIARITLMLTSLRSRFGALIQKVDGLPLYSFPLIHDIANASEDDLRALGMGYRAKFLIKSAKLLDSLGGEEFLLKLRTKSREEVRENLLQFPGIGNKVADCIALFSLDKLDVIPVDTHVWQIAKRDYNVKGLAKLVSVTPAVHETIGNFFRDLYGEHAGWAHCILFVADLKTFADQSEGKLPMRPRKRRKI